MLSIIIPTLNEEKYLPRLLESIKSQDYTDYEIVVADCKSKDNTTKIAKSYNCKVVKVAKRLPGCARNTGAKYAQGNLLLFVDADNILPSGFLSSAIKEFKKYKLGGLGYCIEPDEEKVHFKIITSVVSSAISIFQYFKPVLPQGCAILTTKKLHNKIGGFIERPVLGEDFAYFRAIAKIAKFRVLSKPKIIISMRRFESEGVLALFWKYILIETYALFKKEVTFNKTGYKFGRFV